MYATNKYILYFGLMLNKEHETKEGKSHDAFNFGTKKLQPRTVNSNNPLSILVKKGEEIILMNT